MPDLSAQLLLLTAGRDDSRLDRFLAEALRERGLSREKIKILIRSGRVKVDGAAQTSPRHGLCAGSEVLVELAPKAASLRAEEGELRLIYHDERLAVLDKPAGLTVHPAPGREKGTLAARLLARFPGLAAQDGFRPGIVHRLDKDTSGLMLAALDEKSRLALAAAFAGHEVYKEYLAIARGVPDKDSGLIDAPVGRHPANRTKMAVTPGGKAAKSAWKLLYAGSGREFSLIAVRIYSGRTHQVRVHMLHIGHPLLGDRTYGTGGGGPGRPARQMLHAWKLGFTHPFPGSLDLAEGWSRTGCGAEIFRAGPALRFFCPPPRDFLDAVRVLSARPLKVVITGSPGCGKSSLLARFAESGFPVFSADAEVARLYAPGGDGQALLRAHFGERFVPDETKPVDKSALGAAMRESEAFRREVEALLHPLVFHALQDFWKKSEAAGRSLAVAEIPLFLESGRRDGKRREDDGIVLVGVHCPFALREERLESRRGWTRETTARMESWQWPEEKKMKACDLVLDNSGPGRALPALAKALEADLLALREERLEKIVSEVSAICSGRKDPLFPVTA